MASKEKLWDVLKHVNMPGFNRPIVGAVKGLEVENGEVTITLAISHFGTETKEQITGAVADALKSVDGVKRIRILLSQPVMPASPPAPAGAEPARSKIHQVLAVGSGKGGVGKSTVAVNLAVALAQQGNRVGLMDADIFGPNVPRMVGIDALPEKGERGIPPAFAHGLKVISVGFLVDASKAVVWRGPMTDKVLRQFLEQVEWGELDTLVVDLPPGTGDIAISLARHAKPDGAVVVVTPQGVASDDARKAINMFQRLDVPVLGIVENMSYFECDNCGTRHSIFGEGGGQALASEVGVPLLGEIPFEPVVREGGDSGTPAALKEDSPAGSAFHEIAARVRTALEEA